MDSFVKRLSVYEEKFLVYSLMFSTTLIFIQVLMRYVFSNSLSWSEELARYIFLWQIWIGASYAISLKKHFVIDIVVVKLHGNAKKAVDIIACLLFLFFAGFLAAKGTSLVMFINSQKQMSPAMQIPMAYPYAAIPVGGILMVTKLLAEIKQIFTR